MERACEQNGVRAIVRASFRATSFPGSSPSRPYALTTPYGGGRRENLGTRLVLEPVENSFGTVLKLVKVATQELRTSFCEKTD